MEDGIDLTLYDHPDLFDAVMQSPQSTAFYLEQARRRAGAILELGCGSGRVTIPLAAAGLDVTGLDISPAMLDAARKRAAGLPATFVAGDMRSFALGRSFGMVFIAVNSLQHLHRTDELIACFRCIASHLGPGGRFVFDVVSPSVKLLARAPDIRYAVGRFTHPSRGEILLEETVLYDSAAQLNRARWYFSTTTERDFAVVPLTLRCLFPEELPLVLRAGGLELEARYGDFSEAQFTSASAHQVCVCAARS